MATASNDNMLKFFETTDAKIATQAYNSGSLYVTETNKLYFDSPKQQQRILINSSQIITTAINLNTLIVDGTYSIENTGCTNIPVAAKGTLRVSYGSTIITQVFTSIGDKIYTRSAYIQSGTVIWNNWVDLSINTINDIPVFVPTTAVNTDTNTTQGIYYFTAYNLNSGTRPNNSVPAVLHQYNIGNYRFQTYYTNSSYSAFRIYDGSSWTDWFLFDRMQNLESTVRTNNSTDVGNSNIYTYGYTMYDTPSSATNLPSIEAGVVKNYVDSKFILQEFITATGRMFLRSYNKTNSTWTAWTEKTKSDKAIQVVSSFDLDNMLTTGIYHCNDASLIINLPLSETTDNIKIEIDIYESDVFVTQKILIQNILFTRLYTKSTSTWSAWTSYKSIYNMNSNTMSMVASSFDELAKLSNVAIKSVNSNATNKPSTEAGFLESMKGDTYWMQRYTTITGKVYVRFYTVSSASWGSWKTLHS